MASEEGWSTISHKEKPKRSAGVRTEAQESSCVRNDLVGRNVYQYQSADGGGGNMDISDLIGEPVVLRESSLHLTNENGDTTDQSQGRRGLIKLTPQLKKEMEQQRAVDFSLDSPSDWPSFPVTQRQSGDHAVNYNRGAVSWSNVLQAPVPKKPIPTTMKQNSDSDSDEEGTKKAKKKKKNKSEGLITEKQPLTLELSALFTGLQVQPSKGKKVVLATGGGLAISAPTPYNTKIDNTKVMIHSGNILDSTAPQVRRGKEREKPKKRKPTPLRKVIDKEKAARKNMSSLKAANHNSNDCIVEEANNDISDCTMEEANDDTNNCTMEEANDDTNDCTMEEANDDTNNSPLEEANDDTDKPHPFSFGPTKPGHNRRFREYCTHILTEEINECAASLLSELLRFQDRQFLKDPIKAKAKKRYVCGMREVLKHLKLRRVKCLIVAPNMERIQSEGGVDDVIGQILSLAEEQSLPIIFALSRRRLAFTLKKSHKVGCVGVFRHEGAESHYKLLLELVEDAREKYKMREADLLATPTHPHTSHTPWDLLYDSPTHSQTLTLTPPTTQLQNFTPTASHVTKSLNVFAEEFSPNLLFNVHAPEFHPTR